MAITLLKYAEHLEAIHDEYRPLMLDLLNRIKFDAEHQGLNVDGPINMSDDVYRWTMLITEQGAPQDTGVDVSIDIVEERNFDDDEGWGINFGLSIVEYGGLILGEYQPFNFTPEVWVDSRVPYEVQTRWAYMDSISVDEVTHTIANSLDNNRSSATAED